MPPTFDPEGNVDIVRRSLMGSDDVGSVVSPSVATAHEGTIPEGALVVVGDPKVIVGDPGDDKDGRVQELQRFIRPCVHAAQCHRMCSCVSASP